MDVNYKIAIIGTVGLPAKYGGFETLAHYLTKKLKKDFNFTVYCSGAFYSKSKKPNSLNDARLIYLPFKANGIQSIIYDALSIFHSLFYADVLLILGVPGAFMIPFVKLFTSKKVITSIDGIEWKREKWNILAKVYLFLMESIAVRYSDVNISDNEAIQNYTGLRYNSFSKIIEYGGDHCHQVLKEEEDYVKYPFLHSDYCFKVARIEKENNIHLVLKAFSKCPDRILVIVGNWFNSEYGKELKIKYTSFKNITLLDPIYDLREINLLRSNACLYLHGHSAGGTNPSLVEAMSLGLPILSYSVSYNRVTTEDKAFYFKNEDDLLALIQNFDSLSLETNSKEMRRIAEKRYTWDVIAYKYKKLIQVVVSKKQSVSILPAISKLSRGKLQSMELAQYSGLDINSIRLKNNKL